LQSSLNPSAFFVKSFVSPVKFYARKGLAGVTGNIYSGLHEFNDMAFLLHFLRSTDTFFDIGSNVGAYTLLASGVCGAKSVAIEPVGSTFDILVKNIALNQLEGSVAAINAAAGAEEGTIPFTSAYDTTNHAIAKNEIAEAGTIDVKLVTIDSLAMENSPQLAKIDVEGFETEVLKGMNITLDSAELKAIIIELNGSGERYGYSEGDIHLLLLGKGFRPCNYDPFKRELSEIATYGNFNTIYCRDANFINDRLKSAPYTKIMGEAI